MQRVSAFLPSWEKRSSSASTGAASTVSGGGGGGLFGWPNRSSSRNSTASTGALATAADPSSHRPAKLSIASANGSPRVQRESFWPATLDQECDKAARILKSFCSDGYLAPLNPETPSSPLSSDEPTTPTKIMKRIPKRIIQNAAGIAVFTCMRNGLWMTGSGGSGILIARKSDGTWSPPSGIMLHTPTLSFVIGVDIYDCILVVSDLRALEAMIRPRVTLGEDVGLVSGQSVAFDSEDSEFSWTDPGATVLTYLKSRGQHQHVNLTGCMLTERANENERFYGSEVTQMDILAGNVSRHVEETKPLFEVIKMAEGRTDYDSSVINLIAATAAPGDAVIASPKTRSASSALSFGMPDEHDPDPFGVLALEMAGLEIREAGSRVRPTSSQMNYSQVVSPTTSKFPRQSMDTFLSRSNRGSYMSNHTVKSQATDAGTQTTGGSPGTTPSPEQNDVSAQRKSIDQVDPIPEVKEEEEEPVDYTRIDTTALKHISSPPSIHSATSVDLDNKSPQTNVEKDEADKVSKASSIYEKDSESENDADDSDVDDLSDEEPVVFEVAAVQPARTQQVASRVMQAKGSMVTIPKRLPPPLPIRNPGRRSRLGGSDIGLETSALRSPQSQEFGVDVPPGPRSEGDLSRRNSAQSSISHNRMSTKSSDNELDTPTAEESAPRLAEKVVAVEREHSDPPQVSKVPESVDGQSQPEHEEGKAYSDDRTQELGQTDTSQPDDGRSEVLLDEGSSATNSRASTESSDSISGAKHTSSISTDQTEGRASLDDSSMVTPTAGQPSSAIGESTEDKTLQKSTKAEEATEANPESPSTGKTPELAATG
ncbi:las17-binding protein actin regulator domain-containing protein [Sarocladium implicatum]|nr:las17-binding protein actin regulator domain-containing protein [Sarocladium implicatum]